MTTSRSRLDPVVIETRYVWGKTITDAMRRAMEMEQRGWKIQGNPSPMFYNGIYGTGVSISRGNND
jgi:hypothetical protein